MQLTVNSKQLPVGWEVKTIGEVCKTGAGGTPLKSKKEYYEGGKIPWLLSGEVAQGEIFKSENFITQTGLENSSAKIFPINTVLVAMYGATAGQVGILRFEAATNQAVCGILPNEKFIPEFIYYVLLLKKAELISQATGNAQPNISQIKIKNTEIPIPPLPEQKRIVAILDEAFEGIDRAISNTEKNLSNARELFESYLNSIFSQKGEGWEEKKLGDLLDTLTDYHANGSYEILKQNVSLLDNDGYAYMVRSTDFENNFTNSLKYIDKHAYEFLRKSKVFGGEIIISKIGNAGKVYLMPSIDRPCSLAMNLFLLRTDAQHIQSDYLYFFLESQFGKVQIAERLNGTTTKTIRKDGIRSLNILVPPLSEQKKIVEKLDSIVFETQQLETIYRQKIAALKELKQSILQKAFTGELTTDKGVTVMEETAA